MNNHLDYKIPTNLRPYLDDIAKRLYTRHAAVMVGSGFSRNADKPNPESPSLPDWTHLGDMFAKLLYGDDQTHLTRYMNVPSLAHEVEAAIGRPALEQLLRDAIPDLEHEPSSLHIELLGFPWIDVFTTNYDTLLERASRTITTRRYDFVNKQEDLVFAERPRIIKLHGSLRSSGPLIITDEDYRLYPSLSAPLLNTVRQCLLENTLCLIGFSGTDPNFLQWVGWIHDNLGKRHSSRVYLIGAFNLSTSQIQLLERRNIVLVDMSQCKGIESGDHFAALKRFIDYLKSKRTDFEHLAWPTENSPNFPDWDKITLNQLSAIVKDWKLQRQKYPGWVIVPDDRRKLLSRAVEQVLSSWSVSNPLHQTDLPLFVDFEFAFEFVWRIEKCLNPIFDPQLDFFKSVTTRYWAYIKPPSPEEIPTADHRLSIVHQHSRDQIRTKLIHLALALMRYYREEGLREDWSTTSELLSTIKNTMSSEQHAQYRYELALGALFDLDLKKFHDTINEWQFDESLPFWEAKRAGLLSEIGKVEEAKQILSNSLKSIRTRSNLKPVEADYSLISQEAHVMMLLQSLPVPISRESKDSQPDNDTRWSMLYQYKCDPRNELTLFESILNRPIEHKSEVTEIPAFDIGQMTRTYSFHSRNSDLLTAFNYLHFCEDAGLRLDVAGKSTQGVIARTAAHAPHWAIVSLFRLGHGEQEVINSIFGRYSLSRLHAKFIDNLVEHFLNILDIAKPDIVAADNDWDYNFGLKIAHVVPEALSRLCSKCSPHMRQKILDFLSGIYNAATKGRYSGIRRLTPRLLQAFTVQERIAIVPRLLDFPVIANINPAIGLEFPNPIRFLHLTDEWTVGASKPPSDKVGVWLAYASSADPHVRRWALFTLAALHDWSLLTDEHRASFAEVLWNQCDETGWPSDTGFRPCHFLTLPHSESHNPVDLFRQYLHQTPFPEDPSPNTSTIGGENRTVLYDIQWASRHFPWTKDDLHFVLKQSINWWRENQDKADLVVPRGPFMFGDSDFEKAVLDLIGAIASVIQASANLLEHCNMMERVQDLIHDLGKHNFPVNYFTSVCFGLLSEDGAQVFQKIKLGLASSDTKTIHDSFRAVRALLDQSDTAPIRDSKQELSDLLCAVGQIVFWRRQFGLTGALDTISYAVKICPWSLSRDLELLVLEGLRHLVSETVIHTPSGLRQALVVDEHDFANRLATRRSAAGLAYALFVHYSDSEDVVPTVISDWYRICRSDDEFAEVRNEWILDRNIHCAQIHVN